MLIKNRQIWNGWAETLHRWGMQDAVATVMEAVRPMGYIGAQAVYITQPFLQVIFPNDHVTALAALLENSENTLLFTQMLRSEEFSSSP